MPNGCLGVTKKREREDNVGGGVQLQGSAWEDRPETLRSWIQKSDGLKVDVV